ncbi:uncharacterized protein E0L32_011966 [Thyridium curvatum]|uniref:Importin N-terminal domain-containing protein n=1 Tax=Thyridium curvatum TaxID=1093900 RepID=A0A507B4C0_9PEZI|nr:uncharacterized protein E0L32_011966 [Thyridium curvatum]TPX17965.1 hypothetical protein E0L32_011966 [Thyridium curvatum]
MSFAIEVPGETVPLNFQDLCRALQAGTSTDHNQRQSAGTQLTEWEAHEDFFPSLQTVYLDKTLPHDIRFLAIILFKNGVDKYWRFSASRNTIKRDRKALIRSRLFQGTIDEEDKPLAALNTVAAAKIVRIDYPQEWPDALSTIIELLRASRSSNPAHLYGALLILLRVVKELSAARLRRSQTALQAVTPEIVQLLGEIYSANTASWLEFLTSGRGDEDAADYAMQNSLAALKTLRRLMTSGYEYPHNSDLVREVWGLSQSQFAQFLGFISHDSRIPAPYQDVVGKHLLQFTKLHIEMCEGHPASFANLPNSLPLVHAYWELVVNFADVFDKSGGIRQSAGDNPEGKSKLEGPLLERLALKGLLLIRACIAMVFKPQFTFKYRSQEVKKEQEQASHLVKTELLTNDFVLQVVNVIITKLFIFRQSDLEAWEESPEEWESQERDAGEAWQWQVRPCAERVFLDLLIHYKDILGPPLLSYFQTAMQSGSEIVLKEAVYTAMGSAASTIHTSFDFSSFVESTIVGDVQQQGPLAKVLRRRIAILLSQWVPVHIEDRIRPIVFDIFRHFMSSEDAANDEVVRITAARQFKAVVDAYEFSSDLFMPYASDILSRLITILREVEVDETRLAILESTRACVSRMDKNIAQVSDQLMASLPAMWNVAGEDNYMIKQSVLGLLSNIIMALGADSQRYHHSVLPLIDQALDTSSAIHQFLLEDAVDVWRSVMTMAPTPLSPELCQLEPRIHAFCEYDSGVSEGAVEIIKRYIMGGQQSVIADLRIMLPTLAALVKAVDSKHREQVSSASKCLEYMIRVAQDYGGVDGLRLAVSTLHSLGFLSRMFQELHEAWEARQTTGPKARPSRLDTMKKTQYFNILARIAYGDPGYFAEVLASIGGGGGDLAQMWKWLVDEWFESSGNMADLEPQKMSCLALTRMTELPEPVQSLTQSRLQDYLTMWTTIAADVHEGDLGGPDALVWVDVQPDEWDSPASAAEKEFLARDPVHREATFPFVQARLQALVERAGGQARFAEEWLVNVDKEVVAEFEALVQGRAKES